MCTHVQARECSRNAQAVGQLMWPECFSGRPAAAACGCVLGCVLGCGAGIGPAAHCVRTPAPDDTTLPTLGGALTAPLTPGSSLS